MRSLGLSALFCLSIVAGAQSADVGKQVYSTAENSVFLVYLNDAQGSPTALGSAFMVKPRTLITNAHVVDAGNPVLAVGPVRIPVKVVRVDRLNDLAELSVDVDLVSTPLVLSEEVVKPGEQIYAIGNPEGLEKSISQGIVSGLRQQEGKSLIQISSPISHGSSGGPVLNAKGEVIGVAAAFLGEGQNLNFAVPVDLVKALLEARDMPAGSLASSVTLTQVKDIFDQRQGMGYEAAEDSDYQKLTKQLTGGTNALLKSTNDPATLRQLACFGAANYDLLDTGLEAARRLAKDKPTGENQALLSFVLYNRSDSAGVDAIFAKKGSDDERQANAQRDEFLAEANSTAAGAALVAHGDSLLVADFVLGEVKDSRGDLPGAITMHTKVAATTLQVCDTDLSQQSLQSLISENSNAGNTDAAEKAFRDYSVRYRPGAYEWDGEGDRRYALKDYSTAAIAYESAASTGDVFAYDYCYAALSRRLQTQGDDDAILKDGKQCVDAAAKNTNKSNEKYFTEQVPNAYSMMAGILEERGVYPTALEYVKESLAAKPDDAWTLNTEATIYEDQERFTECEAVETEAIRLSDGKYPSFQFRLGNCYFAQSKWTQAENSFRLAAQADKSDAVSAFNLGLSLSREGMSSDAVVWFREALKRNPDAELRGKLVEILK